MAGSEELEKLHCVCRALLLRANASGFELHCRRCDRRIVIPFAEVQGKEQLVRYMRAWLERERRPRS